jgi:UTP--glucose-1-phosphate uridylyltransferase
MKAVIPAAGLGTRFLPATKAIPKEMLPIIDKPAIQFVVEEAVDSGIDDIIIITGRGKRAIEDHFDRSFELEHVLKSRNKTETLKELERIADLADLHYVRQKNPLGLPNAIACARKHIGGESFAVLLGDDIIRSNVPCTRQMIDVHRRTKCPIVAVLRVPEEKLHKYGVVKGKAVSGMLSAVEDMVEKPPPGSAPSNMAMVGRYIFTTDIFDAIDSIGIGRTGEYELPDAIKALMENGRNVYALEFEGERFDIGDKGEYVHAIVRFAMEREDIIKGFSPAKPLVVPSFKP